MAKKLPPYGVWRDGRPRWSPGPALRARGYRGQDLKDGTGRWMSFGQASDAIERLNAEAEGNEPQRLPPSAQNFSALIAEYKTNKGSRYQKLAASTRLGYDCHLRIIDEWCGDIAVALLPRKSIRKKHADLVEVSGLSMANAVMRVLNVIVNYAIDELEWPVAVNRARKLKNPAPDGRIVVLEPAEILTLIAAADFLDMQAVGDGILVGCTTGQRMGDIVAMAPWVAVEGVFRLRQGKTGADAFLPEMPVLTTRLDLMAARKAQHWPNVAFKHLLIAGDGTPYRDSKSFGDEFRKVRAVASGLALAIEQIMRAIGGLPPIIRNMPFKPVPSLLGKTFADLRDTAVTWLYEATRGDLARVVTITGHSIKTAQTIIDRHYFKRRPELARLAGNDFNAYLERIGFK